jgi:hypothetical protein
MANKPTAKKDEVPIVPSPGTAGVKPSDNEPLDHGDKRAFQTGPEPGQREYLTEAEAKKRGFYWAPDEDTGKKKKG